MSIHRSHLAVLLLVLLILDVGAQAPVVADHAWARQPARSRDVTAVYAVLRNTTAEPMHVVSGVSAIAASVELHEMTMDGAMMRMRRVHDIVVPAHGTVELKPGGLHLMVFGLRRPLNRGERLPLILRLADGGTVALDAEVRAPESQR